MVCLRAVPPVQKAGKVQNSRSRAALPCWAQRRGASQAISRPGGMIAYITRTLPCTHPLLAGGRTPPLKTSKKILKPHSVHPSNAR